MRPFRGVPWRSVAFLGVACCVLGAGGAQAAPCVLPYTLVSGTVASATQVMGNFNTLVNCFAPIDLSAQTLAQTFIDRPGSTTSPAQPYSSTVASQRWELAMGSQASPITTGGPALRITMATAYSTNTITNSCNNQPAQVACVSAAIFVNQGIATSKGSSIGVSGIGTNIAALGAGTNDTIGVLGVGEILLGGTGIGFGGYFQGQRDGITSLGIGVEATMLNSTGVDCTPPGTGAFLYTGIGQCDGIWVSSRGAGAGVNSNSSAIHVGIGDAFSWWAEGITFNNNSIKTTTFNDQSGAGTSINIAGVHTYALATGSTAGDFGFGTATPGARMHLVGNKSASYWGANGIALRVDPSTFTDTTSAGATAAITMNTLGIGTIAASAATTYASASTLYIANCPAAGTNVTITACYGLLVGATINANAYAVAGTPGVTCGAGLGASTRTINGLVTTC